MNEQRNLPSKQFIIRGSVALGIVVVILTVQTQWFQGLLGKKKQPTIVADPLTVQDLINKDTNGNGIPNWEEKLWGLDPTTLYTNGIPNSEIIEQKKKSLGVTTENSSKLNETDMLARQLYGLTAALGQSEESDTKLLSEIGAKIGNSVDVQIKMVQYSAKDLTTTTTSVATLQTYYTAMKKITAPYEAQNLPDLDVLLTALENEDFSTISQLDISIPVYKKIARDLRSVTVPIGIAPYHLQIMNSFAGIATSFEYMQQLEDNSVVALVGIAAYRTHVTRLDTALANSTDYLARYGILTSSQ